MIFWPKRIAVETSKNILFSFLIYILLPIAPTVILLVTKCKFKRKNSYTSTGCLMTMYQKALSLNFHEEWGFFLEIRNRIVHILCESIGMVLSFKYKLIN